MRWTHKARIQRACARTRLGGVLYRQLQQRFGTLDSDPFIRLPQQASLIRNLAECGFDTDGARCLEVGTGHLPIAPVAFYLAGAAEVVTVDLHRRLHPVLTSAMLARLVASEDRLIKLYDGIVDAQRLRERLAIVNAMSGRPFDLLEKIGVHYVAPGDAARMPDADGTFDLSFSITVLEHVEPDAMRHILTEARRVLRTNGFAAHLIDPSDHFAHQDDSITRVNFLRFSAREWRRLGGNEFSYCNRLRATELERVFLDCGFSIERSYRTVDDRSQAELSNGFPLHSDFRDFDVIDLCTTGLEIYARPRSASETEMARSR
jgi:SAM-dependent methyltransferase